MAAEHNGNAGGGRSTEMRWKVASLLAGVLAAKVAKSAMHGTWKKIVGGEPPSNPKSPETSWGDAVVWAALSGAAVGITRTLSQQSAAGVWKRVTGALPPGLEEGAAR